MPRSKSYKAELLKALENPDEAKAYLNAALEEDDLQVFLLALRDVAEAQMGMTQLAEKSERNRESLYRTLSEKGNPELAGIVSILRALGYRFTIETQTQVSAQ